MPFLKQQSDNGLRFVSMDEWPQLVASDPGLQQILKGPSNKFGNIRPAVQAYLQRKGLTIGPTNTIDAKSGQMIKADVSGMDAFFQYGVPALAAGAGAAAIGGSIGAAGAAAPVTGAGTVLPSTAISLPVASTTLPVGAASATPAIGAAVGTGGTVGGTVAAGAGGASLWKTLAAPAIGAGTQIAGSLIQANQNDKATQAELQKAREAQAFLEKKYEQTQNQVAPYVNMGQGALAALGNGLGVTPANPAVLQPGQSRPVGQTTSGFIPPNDFSSFKQQVQAQNPTAQIPNMPAQQNQAASAQNLSQSSVRLQSPDGKEVQDVPADHAQYYISQGAKVVA